MKCYKVAGAAVNTTPLDWSGNLEVLQRACRAAREAGVAVLVLPELAISGYGCDDAFYADETTRRALYSLKQLLPETAGLVVAVGLPMTHENSVYNVVALLHDGQVLGFVAKQTLPGDGVHYEPRWFKEWPQGALTDYLFEGQPVPFGDMIFEVDGIRIGLEICEDAWAGRRPAERHYYNNVDLILNPSASHFAFGKTRIRHNLVTEASRAYACTYVYTNLVGNEAGRIVYDGEILIAQSGKLLAQNERFQFSDFQLVTAVVDPESPRRAKKKLFSFEPLPHLNTELVVSDGPEMPVSLDAPSVLLDVPDQDLPKEEEFCRAVTLGLWDYMRKSRSRGFVISLSGGADSSACAVLCARALTEPLRVLGADVFYQKLGYWPLDKEKPVVAQGLALVYQATANSGEATETSARKLAEGLDAPFHLWQIQEQLEGYHRMTEQALGRQLSWATDDLALQNVQARVRAPGVWMVANVYGALLITTSNRSEAAVGYCTMDGDTSGGLAPLGGIDKATLLKWLRWAETALALPSLRYVNQLQPTAELRPPDKHQTDEADLMPYAVLDRIERCAIHEYRSPLETFQKLRPEILEVSSQQLGAWIGRFFRLWARNQWKRERYAPSFHLDDANLDPRTWCRFPILNGGFEQELQELQDYLWALDSPSI